MAGRGEDHRRALAGRLLRASASSEGISSGAAHDDRRMLGFDRREHSDARCGSVDVATGQPSSRRAVQFDEEAASLRVANPSGCLTCNPVHERSFDITSCVSCAWPGPSSAQLTGTSNVASAPVGNFAAQVVQQLGIPPAGQLDREILEARVVRDHQDLGDPWIDAPGAAPGDPRHQRRTARVRSTPLPSRRVPGAVPRESGAHDEPMSTAPWPDGHQRTEDGRRSFEQHEHPEERVVDRGRGPLHHPSWISRGAVGAASPPPPSCPTGVQTRPAVHPRGRTRTVVVSVTTPRALPRLPRARRTTRRCHGWSRGSARLTYPSSIDAFQWLTVGEYRSACRASGVKSGI